MRDVLQNVDEKITDMVIMAVSAEEKPRRDKMCAIGKGQITIDSGAAESLIPKDMLKQYVTVGLRFCGWERCVELWLQAAPFSICTSGRCREHGGVLVYHRHKTLRQHGEDRSQGKPSGVSRTRYQARRSPSSKTAGRTPSMWST